MSYNNILLVKNFINTQSRNTVLTRMAAHLNKKVKIDYAVPKSLAAKKLKARGIDPKLYEAVQIVKGWEVIPSNKEYTPKVAPETVDTSQAQKPYQMYSSALDKGGVPHFIFKRQPNPDKPEETTPDEYLMHIEILDEPTTSTKRWVVYEAGHPENVIIEITDKNEAVKWFGKGIATEVIDGYYNPDDGLCYLDEAYSTMAPLEGTINGEKVDILVVDKNTGTKYTPKPKKGTWEVDDPYIRLNIDGVVNITPID